MKNNPQRIILHHSLTKDGVVLSSFDAIKRYHVIQNGWSDIGYHLVLEYVNNKLVWEKGRDLITRGAHCKEQQMNFKSIGICVVGNFDIDYLTDDHINMILAKQVELEILLNRKLPIEFHRKYATYKTCPGNHVTKEMFEVNKDEPSSWAKESWDKATTKGIVDGSRPKEFATREEVIVMIDRMGL